MYGNTKGIPSKFKAEYLTDPRLALAAELQKTGGSTAPVQTPLEGLARALTGVVGGYQSKMIGDEYKQRGADYNQALATAMSDPKVKEGIPAWKDPTTGKELVPAVAPGMDSYAAILSSGNNKVNPDVQAYVQELQSKDMEAKNAMRYKTHEIYDPTSPSGTRLVSEADAIGKPGKPTKGSRISVGPDGQVTIEEGVLGIGGGSSLAKPTMNKIEEKMLDSSEALGRLNNISATFKPEFLQLGTRAGAKVSEMKEFMGGKLDPKEEQGLQEFTVFRQNSTDNLNRLIKDLTGASMGVDEAKRIISTAPNAGAGVFDGDAPTPFKAKLDNSTTMIKNSVMRMNWAKANGLNPLKSGVELHEVPALIEREGRKIEGEIKAKNPNLTESQINMEVRLRLGKKFGMR